MKPTLFIKMSTGTLTIEDLGLIVTTAERELTAEYDYAQLADSVDLWDAIGTTNLEFTKTSGGTVLSDQEVQDVLSTFNLDQHDDIISGNPHNVSANDIGADAMISEINANGTGTIEETKIDSAIARDTEVTDAITTHAASDDHDDRYFTETELSSSGGGGQVHWNNITNKPQTGTGQYAPVDYFCLDVNASAAPAEPGDASATKRYYYVDDQTTPHLWESQGAGWVDLGAIDSGDRFVDLNDTGEPIKEWDGSAFNNITPEGGYELTNKNDWEYTDDGGQVGYVYNGAGETPANTWVFRFSVDTDVNVSLDDAYNNGKVINVDDGSIDMNQSDGYSPFVFNEKASAPTTAPAAGKTGVFYSDGVLYMYDPDRAKWLSVEKFKITFGIDRNNNNAKFLPLYGTLPALKSGERLPRNATLVAIIVDSDSTHTANYEVRKKASSSNTETTLAITSAAGGQNIAEDTDFSASDVPIVYMDGSDIDYPVVTLIFAYRKA